jgi:transposase
MAQDEAFVGIDVAKHELVVHAHLQGLGWRLANSPEGRTELVRQLRRMASPCRLRIGFEPSGGYERRLAILLEKKGFEAYLLDAGRVHAFGRAEGKLAKTDPLDAALIARALAALHGDLEPWRHDPLAERMTERVRLREAIIAQTVQLAGHLESLADPAMRRLATGQIARLKALALRLEAAIGELLASCPDLARREALLRSAPGVGPIVAATLLAHMPELGSLNSRQVAALAGLTPFDRQSGTARKPGRCHGGRPAVRRVLYLAALSILRSGKSPLANLGKRLKENGKPAKLAIITTARKLLVTLNAMLKQAASFHTP